MIDDHKVISKTFFKKYSQRLKFRFVKSLVTFSGVHGVIVRSKADNSVCTSSKTCPPQNSNHVIECALQKY